MFGTELFKSSINIPDDVDVIFVSDMFIEDYVGGAELTTEAIIQSSPLKICKLHSKDVTIDIISKAANRYWLFGNFAQLKFDLIPTIIGNLRYSIIEYDYKYCLYRSPEKHQEHTKQPCDCHQQMNGKVVSAFFYGADHIFWMSEAQMQKYVYTAQFHFLLEKENIVLSSVFSNETLAYIQHLHDKNSGDRDNRWIVLGSNSWVKGASTAEQWCKDNHKEYEVVWNVPYKELLEKLSKSRGFVYLPVGADTCPRMVIEAKLLGCEIVINDNVQHGKESWFDTDDLQQIYEYLRSRPSMFWNVIKSSIDYVPKISGYVTTYNCISQKYPFKECIRSMLRFCDEVCVVDGGSEDNTWEQLVDLAHPDAYTLSVHDQTLLIEDLRAFGCSPIQSELKPTKIKLKNVKREWSAPNHAIFDGQQKAIAREMCSGDFCWQMDSDEIVHEEDIDKIINMCKRMPTNVDIISLPVIEYWGSQGKVRVDVQPWKWRLSRNKPYITHGIPKDLRVMRDDGTMFAKPGTDGCDMIDLNTGEPLPHVSFYTVNVEYVRQRALSGDMNALKQYETWFNSITCNIPVVFHYSWYDMERKIRLYRDYWSSHWQDLIGASTADTAENNMFFDVPWSQVTDEMIVNRAKELTEKLGGWVWHKKWDGRTLTPHIKCNRTQPIDAREITRNA